jgi:hypothetical protein
MRCASAHVCMNMPLCHLPHLGWLQALEKVITRSFARHERGVAARVVLGEGLEGERRKMEGGVWFWQVKQGRKNWRPSARECQYERERERGRER